MEVYKPLGALAVLIIIVGLVYLVVKWPQGKHTTFSQHAAAHKHTILYYNLLFTIVLPLLLLFFIGWFVPEFGMSPWFMYFLVPACVAQYVVTVIPETGGWKTAWHRVITFTSVLLLLLALSTMVLSPAFSTASKAFMLASLVAMAGIISFVAFRNGQHKYLLYFQAGYYAAFFMPVLLVAYAGV